jgi:hypothetical protein
VRGASHEGYNLPESGWFSLEDTVNTNDDSDFGCTRFFVFAMVFEVALLIAILLW